jgi:hypothetical protein
MNLNFVDRLQHSFGRFIGLIGATGFPNLVFGDSWVVGFWRADHGGHKVSKWEDELEGWLEPFLDCLGHKARRRMCTLCVSGLIGPGDRKRPADGGAAGAQ